ncbi:hypothetical protein SZN_29105 [Streptomyces zinciresistens K42]|uniref:Uncharacterized protein n=1 Tax=Streptomyces zinciresistens K42 TaxID=700597 RepID=G2GJX8_9ACTN|nr:hypothetical protein SZN_29105 [Streptomyces zinciresistens K42]
MARRGVRIAACPVPPAALLPLMPVQLAGTGQPPAYVLGFSSGRAGRGRTPAARALSPSPPAPSAR